MKRDECCSSLAGSTYGLGIKRDVIVCSNTRLIIIGPKPINQNAEVGSTGYRRHKARAFRQGDDGVKG